MQDGFNFTGSAQAQNRLLWEFARNERFLRLKELNPEVTDRRIWAAVDSKLGKKPPKVKKNVYAQSVTGSPVASGIPLIKHKEITRKLQNQF